jgi:hypothetical protein
LGEIPVEEREIFELAPSTAVLSVMPLISSELPLLLFSLRRIFLIENESEAAGAFGIVILPAEVPNP